MSPAVLVRLVLSCCVLSRLDEILSLDVLIRIVPSCVLIRLDETPPVVLIRLVLSCCVLTRLGEISPAA